MFVKRSIFAIVSLLITNLALSQNFTHLIVSYPGQININYASKFSITINNAPIIQEISADTTIFFGNIIFKFSLSDSLLEINGSPELDFSTITINTPIVKKITFNTAGMLNITGNFYLDSLNLINKGAGYIKLDTSVIVKNLNINNSGAGIIDILTKYRIINAKISVDGAGIINAPRTEIAELKAEISGASFCQVNVTDNLIANVSGFSVLIYAGNPKHKQINANGLVVIHQKTQNNSL